MANFRARVRTTYADVGGLVLDLNRGTVESQSGVVTRWRNAALGLVGPTPTQPIRFGDAVQPVVAERPALAGGGGVAFTRASSHSLRLPLADAIAAGVDWTLAYELVKGASAANNQVVLATNGTTDMRVRRRDAAGVADLQLGGTTTARAVDHPDGMSLVALDQGASPVTLAWTVDNASSLAGNASNLGFAAGDSVLIGRDAAGNHLDGTIDSIRLWNRRLSPLERDLVHQTLDSDAVDQSASQRAPLQIATWTDETADPSLRQFNRINPVIGAPHRFNLATLDDPLTNGAWFVQIAAEVDGVTLPDTALGGDLFTINFIESPGLAPVVTQDAGWSAVFDLALLVEGHYTIAVVRENGGSFILHLDAEVV